MMSLEKKVERASWPEFAVWFAALFAFNWWAFYTSSPWTRALAAGGGKLPESQFDFPGDEPQRSLDILTANDALGDYLVWQAFDIPYAVLNLMAMSLAIALGLKALGLSRSALRFLVLLPVLYLVCEVVENSLVAAFAARLLPPEAPAVLAQQTATAAKAFSGYGSIGLSLLSLIVAAISATAGLFRKRT